VERTVGQHHGDLRRALIEAALALVADGVDPGLRAVARKAGVSPGAPYHHFADKSDLLAEVAREGFAALTTAQAATTGSGGDRLERMTTAYVRFAIDHPTHYEIMFARPPSELAEETGSELAQVALGTFRTLVEAVADANPLLDRPEVERRALMTWAMAHGAAHIAAWKRNPPFGPDGEDLAAEVGRSARRLAEAT
jgi:AcrR family transcriptional regulator